MARALSSDGGQITAVSLAGLQGQNFTAAAAARTVPTWSTQTAAGIIDIALNNIPFVYLPLTPATVVYDIMVVSNGAAAPRNVLLPDSRLVTLGAIVGILNTAVAAGTCQARDFLNAANVGPVIPGIAGGTADRTGGGLFFINVRTNIANGFAPIYPISL
ncbi:hypothetical protein CMI47_17795 [Candidatus Pacearchaeota archaeon]|nr:hypothetical protein [Candidatus Pacearchaeota archaeon]|tara:strand:- start:2499 stop:2978 length:480 start_codon:yes stop_codon:yes gene_type:complete